MEKQHTIKDVHRPEHLFQCMLRNLNKMKGLRSMKAVVYARQSAGDEEESASVETQIEKCKSWANGQGLTVEVYSDKNTSGKTYPDLPDAVALSKADTVYQNWKKDFTARRAVYRKGLADALNTLQAGDVLVVYDFTRIMRPLTDSFLESYLKQKLNGFRIHSIAEGELNLTAFNTSLITSLQSRINDQQISINREKSKTQLLKMRDAGYRYTGANFLGFHNSGKQKVTAVPEELEIVRFIVNKVNFGLPYQMICRNVNSKFPVKHHFNYTDIRKVCLRLEYSGHCLNSAGEIIESKVFPCVIPLADMLKARERVLNKRKIVCRDKSQIHPLTGLVYCGVCGEKLIIQKSRGLARVVGFLYYFNHQNTIKKTLKERPAGCAEVSINLHFKNPEKAGLEDIVLPLLLPELESKIKELASASIDTEKIKFDIARIEELEKILDKKFVDGDITANEYEKRFDEYAGKKKALKQQLLTSANVDTEKQAQDLREICLLITVGAGISPRVYKMLAREFIEKIIVFPDKIEVRFLDGKIITLQRVKMRNSRCFPSFMVHKEKDGMFELQIFYKNGKGETLYQDDYLRITSKP